MKFEIRERDRRALFLLAAAGVIYVVFSFVLLPVFDGLNLGSSTASDKEQQLSKYRRALIRKGSYAQLIDQVQKNLIADESRFVRGDNPTLAAVEVQNIVESAAQKNGLSLTQRNISPARKKDEFFNEITMTVAFEASPAQIAVFLVDIRNAPKFVMVRNAQVAPIETPQEAPPKGNFKKMLRANLTIVAPLPVPVRKNG
jgi:Tfp pilus assembly protein PilO